MTRFSLLLLTASAGCFPADRNPSQTDAAEGDSNSGSDADTDTDSDADSDTDSDFDTDSDAPPPCVSYRFAADADDWALPTLPWSDPTDLQWTQTSGQSSREVSGSYYPYVWSTFDINGDKVLDLVVTYDQAQPAVGRTEWAVYLGGADGFSDTPTDWALPTLTGTGPADILWSLTALQSQRTVNGVAKYYAYSTFDITGDGQLDLVLSWDTTQAAVGATSWKVYVGTAVGFASTPMDWALPTLPYASASDVLWTQTAADTARTVGGATKYYYYKTLDITGDGLLDLVVTYDAAQPGVGASSWSVYVGTAAGFSTEPSVWPLPTLQYASASDIPWMQTKAQTARMVGDVPYYYMYDTFDLTGDGLLDLVMTYDKAEPALGVSSWKVYPGTGTGFTTTGSAWSLPTLPGTGPADLPWYVAQGQSARTVDGVSKGYYWSTFDLNGDEQVDLVLTVDNAQPTVGATIWSTYLGESMGFSDSATAWGLPTLPSSNATDVLWYQTSGQNSRQVGDSYKGFVWYTMDLTGDGLLDIVVSYDGAQSDVGASRWAVYPGECL